MERWNSIQRAADSRHEALERTMGAAKQFHEQLEPFLEWLEAAEKEGQAQEVRVCVCGCACLCSQA